MTMKLIREEIEKVEVLTEERNGKKSLYIKGPFLQAEVVNRNGRMYPMGIMEREVKRYAEDYVKKGRALGELGHPDGPTVNLDRVSHKITELYLQYYLAKDIIKNRTIVLLILSKEILILSSSPSRSYSFFKFNFQPNCGRVSL